MTTVSNYIQYFRHLANMYTSLSHQQETGSATFDVVLQNQVKELDIARTGINPASETLMLAVIPTIELNETEDAQGRRNYTGAFFILKKYHPKNDPKMKFWAVMGEAEQAGIDILERMVKDSLNKHPLFSRSIDTLDKLEARFIERVIDDKWYGYLVTFKFATKIPCTGAGDATKWRDGGITPF
jgi:hypothetical protein